MFRTGEKKNLPKEITESHYSINKFKDRGMNMTEGIGISGCNGKGWMGRGGG